jgi:hypothetical protein
MHPDIFSAGRVVESDINSADCVAQSEIVPPATRLKQIFSAGREAQSEIFPVRTTDWLGCVIWPVAQSFQFSRWGALSSERSGERVVTRL